MPYTRPPEFKIARGPWLWLLKMTGLYGITMPWKTIYVLPEYIDWPELRQHELVHIKQIERHGPVKFTLLYIWYHIRYGYRKNPLEVEAYEIE